MNVFIILISVALNAAAQLFLKKGAVSISGVYLDGITLDLIKKLMNVPILLGFLSYAFSIVLWIYALSKVPVSSAYPFQALGYVFVLFASTFLFYEPITIPKIIGILFIVTGVILIARQLI